MMLVPALPDVRGWADANHHHHVDCQAHRRGVYESFDEVPGTILTIALPRSFILFPVSNLACVQMLYKVMLVMTTTIMQTVRLTGVEFMNLLTRYRILFPVPLLACVHEEKYNNCIIMKFEDSSDHNDLFNYDPSFSLRIYKLQSNFCLNVIFLTCNVSDDALKHIYPCS